MRRKILALVIVLSLASLAVVAQEAKVLVDKDDTLATVLNRHISKTVTLKLDSGEEVTGKLRLVGARVVHLQELSGKEFYDAVVELEDVEAIVVRAR